MTTGAPPLASMLIVQSRQFKGLNAPLVSLMVPPATFGENLMVVDVEAALASWRACLRVMKPATLVPSVVVLTVMV